MNSSRTFQTRRSFLLKAAGTAGAAAVGPPTLLNALGSAFSKSTSGPPGLAQLIEVDFAQKDPADSSLYGRYLNFCGNGEQFTEQDFQLYQKQFGRLKLVRVWGTSYIDYAAQVAEEALMVPRTNLHRSISGSPKQAFAAERMHHAESFIDLWGLVHGTVTEDECVTVAEQYLGAIKAKYPFVTHIEPFNELTAKGLNLPPGMTVEEAYYKGFRVAYRAAKELNRKNSYAKPILVGGPACMGSQYVRGYLKNFITCYANDPDPSKGLDFLSMHYYIDGERDRMMAFRRDTEVILTAYHLPAVPLVVSEVGWKEKGAKPYNGNPMDALRWATGSLAHTYQIAEQNVTPIPWVYPRKEDRYSMVAPATDAPALLPRGNAFKLAQMLKKNHARSSIAVDNTGNGIYSVATFDESGVAILLFNYDATGESPKTVAMKLLHTDKLAEQTGRVTEYLLDQCHGNYFADKDAWQMKPIDSGEKPLRALEHKIVSLKGNAAYMLLISFA